MKEKGVIKVTCDQCQYGCEAEDGAPIKKPTSFMTNALELAKELRRGLQFRLGRVERLVHAPAQAEPVLQLHLVCRLQ